MNTNENVKKERISEGAVLGEGNHLNAESACASDDSREAVTIQSRVLEALLERFRSLGEEQALKRRWYVISSAEVSRISGLSRVQARKALYRLKVDSHLIWYEITGGRLFRIRIPEFCFTKDRDCL